MAYGQRFQQFPAQQQVTFHGLRPGIKYRIRVRAVDGEQNFGAYSDPVDLIAGIGSTSQPSTVVQSVVITEYSLGVVVTWNVMTGAKGYEVYMTKGASPPDPDPSNKAHLYYRGNATSLTIKAADNDTVKVKILWYDQYGRKSTGVASGSGKALDATGS